MFDRKLAVGFEGIRRTVLAMLALAKVAAKASFLKRIANTITNKGDTDTVKSIRVFFWIKKNVEYKKDPLGIEQIKTPKKMIDEIKATGKTSGDCDDYTTLIITLLSALGIKSKVTVVKTGRNKNFNHVYPEALVGGKWLILDATPPGARPGVLLARPRKTFSFFSR